MLVISSIRSSNVNSVSEICKFQQSKTWAWRGYSVLFVEFSQVAFRTSLMWSIWQTTTSGNSKISLWWNDLKRFFCTTTESSKFRLTYKTFCIQADPKGHRRQGPESKSSCSDQQQLDRSRRRRAAVKMLETGVSEVGSGFSTTLRFIPCLIDIVLVLWEIHWHTSLITVPMSSTNCRLFVFWTIAASETSKGRKPRTCSTERKAKNWWVNNHLLRIHRRSSFFGSLVTIFIYTTF